MIEMLSKKINSPLTCSIGRLFDGIASILDICDIITEEAEAAQKLETLATNGWEKSSFSIPYRERNGIYIIDTQEIVRKVVDMKKRRVRISKIARLFHNSISDITIKITHLISKETKIKDIVLSGGVFQNRLLLSNIKNGLESIGLSVYTPRRIPFNDGGISLGQIAIGRGIIK